MDIVSQILYDSDLVKMNFSHHSSDHLKRFFVCQNISRWRYTTLPRTL